MKTWDDLFAEYLKAPGVIDRAVKGKALAVAFQSTRPHDLLYRHTNSGDGEIDRLPMVLVAREDAARMARLLASGQKLYADLSIPNHSRRPHQARECDRRTSRQRKARRVCHSGRASGFVGLGHGRARQWL